MLVETEMGLEYVAALSCRSSLPPQTFGTDQQDGHLEQGSLTSGTFKISPHAVPFPPDVAQACHALQRLHVFGGAPSGLNGTEGMPAVDRPSRPRRSEAGIPEGRCGNEAWWHGLGAIYLHRTEALTSGRNHEVVLQ